MLRLRWISSPGKHLRMAAPLAIGKPNPLFDRAP